jgi:uncharacterized protein YkwD
MHRAVLVLAAACAALAGPAPALADAPGLEQATLREINRARVDDGLGRLRAHDGLTETAERQSEWMAANNVLAHPADLVGRLRNATPHQEVWGETLAWMPGSRETLARRTVRAWLRSAPHRQVLLTGSLQLAGVAAVRGGGGVFVTADFAG